MKVLHVKYVFLGLALSSFISVYCQEGAIKVSNSNYKHSHPRWSPVEDLILFVSNMEGKKTVYTVNSKGENIRRITSLRFEDSYPSWSPDGKQIAYSSIRDGQYQIFVYDLASNIERQLTSPKFSATSEFSAWGPEWSHDGKMITYSAKLSGRNVREIFIIGTDGKNNRRLTYNKKINIIPVFSADDKRIFYQSTAGYNSSGKSDIYSYHLPTSTVERITDPGSGNGIDPFIHPSNKELAFFGGGKTSEGWGTYWIDLETRKMTKFDIKAKTPGHPTWSFDGTYVTIIDRRVKDIYIYDLESAKSIQVTGK